MIMNGDKKGIAALIVKKIGSPKEEMESKENEMGDEVDASAGHDAAVQEMFDAIETKDKSKFKVALKSFIELCEDEEEEEEEGEKEEESESEEE